jgi:hypothetical protein
LSDQQPMEVMMAQKVTVSLQDDLDGGRRIPRSVCRQLKCPLVTHCHRGTGAISHKRYISPITCAKRTRWRAAVEDADHPFLCAVTRVVCHMLMGSLFGGFLPPMGRPVVSDGITRVSGGESWSRRITHSFRSIDLGGPGDNATMTVCPARAAPAGLRNPAARPPVGQRRVRRRQERIPP